MAKSQKSMDMVDSDIVKVDWIGSKVFNGRRFWSFRVGDTFYRTGMDKPTMEVGDNVTFKYEVNDYGNQVDASSISVVSAPAPAHATTSARTVAASSNTKEDYWQNKERAEHARQLVIMFQSATNTAIQLVASGLQCGAFTAPTGSKANKADAFTAMVAEFRNDLFRDYVHVLTQAQVTGDVSGVLAAVPSSIGGAEVEEGSAESPASEDVDDEYEPWPVK